MLAFLWDDRGKDCFFKTPASTNPCMDNIPVNLKFLAPFWERKGFSVRCQCFCVFSVVLLFI